MVRGLLLRALVLTVGLTTIEPVRADRPIQKRENADYVVVGKVNAVYVRDTEGYRQYIVELSVEEVDKGQVLKKGDTFRTFCYQRKKGKGGLEFDTVGHAAVPEEGQRIRAFVNGGRGHHEGVYPDWFEPTPVGKR